MGFEPNVTTGAVGAIMRELDDKFVGLSKVKTSFVELVANMKKAYNEDCLGLVTLFKRFFLLFSHL